MSAKEPAYHFEQRPQNIPSFNRVVRCSRHNKISTMICLAQKCEDRTLCQDCILNHTHSHLAKIIPIQEFNNQTNVVPSVMAREIINFRSTIFQLQNQMIVTRESRKGELKSLFKSIKKIIIQDIDQFYGECISYVDKYFEKFTTEFSSQLYTIQNHLLTLNPFIADQPLEVESKKVEFLINYQETLMNQVIPKLDENVKKLAAEVVKTDIFIEHENFLNKITSDFKRNLLMHGLFVYQDPIIRMHQKQQSLNSVLNPKENNSGLKQAPAVLVKTLPLDLFKNSENNIPFEHSDIGPPFVKIYTGHTDIITSILPLDEKLFASSSGDRTIKVWDIDSGYCMGTISGHFKDIWGLARISDSTIASCSADSSIKIWDYKKLQCLGTLMGHKDTVRCVIYMQDKNMLASGGTDNSIKLWNIQDQKLIKTLGHHEGMVRVLIYLDNKKKLISASTDRLIKVWDVAKAMCQSILRGHEDEVSALCYLFEKNNTDSWIASGGHDNLIIVWDIEKGAQMKQLIGHSQSVNGLTYVEKRGVLISCSSDKTIRFWNINKGECVRTNKVHTDIVNSVVYHQPKNLVISGSWDCNARAESLRVYLQSEVDFKLF